MPIKGNTARAEAQGFSNVVPFDLAAARVLGVLDTPIRMTRFKSHIARSKSDLTISLCELEAMIRETVAPEKADLPWIKLATFGGKRSRQGCLRHNDNVVTVTGVEADYDGGRMTIDEAAEIAKAADLAAVLYETPSSTPEEPRWRIILPFSGEYAPAERRRFCARLNGLYRGIFDQTFFDLSRAFYFGNVEGKSPVRVIAIDGLPLDVVDDLDEGAIDKGGNNPAPVGEVGEPGEPIEAMTDEMLCDALGFIDHGMHYKDWSEVVFAIHHQTGGSPEGRQIAEEWSKGDYHRSDVAYPKGPKSKNGWQPGATEALWDSIRADRNGPLKTAGSIIKLARAAGWKMPTELRHALDRNGFDDIPDEPEAEDEIGNPPEPKWALNMVRASDVEIVPVRWVWKGRLARGKMTLIGGDPGLAKSQISLDIAARVTKGAQWPDGGDAPKGSVVILSAEDAANDTIAPRLKAVGANMDRVHIVGGMERKGEKRGFNLQDDLGRLGERIAALNDVVLVIIDPVTAYMGEGVDTHKAADVRRVLERVAEWAERLDVAVFAITHPPKAAQGKAINSYIGSQAYAAHSQFCLSVFKDDAGRLLMLPVKANIGRASDGLGYKITSWEKDPNISFIEWDGKPVNVSADEILREGRKSKSHAVSDAELFLNKELGFGSKSAASIEAKAREAGISDWALKEAKRNLGVTSKAVGFSPRKWVWFLPGMEEEEETGI